MSRGTSSKCQWFSSLRVLCRGYLITRLRRKIVALTIVTLVASIVKIAYEFHLALPAGRDFFATASQRENLPDSSRRHAGSTDHEESGFPKPLRQTGDGSWLQIPFDLSRPTPATLSSAIDGERSNVSLFLRLQETFRQSRFSEFSPFAAWRRSNNDSHVPASHVRNEYADKHVIEKEGQKSAYEMFKHPKPVSNEFSEKEEYQNVFRRETNSQKTLDKGNNMWPLPVPAYFSDETDSDNPKLNRTDERYQQQILYHHQQANQQLEWLKPFLVILICSKPENTELRLVIRRTWGLDLDPSKVVVRFVIGQDETWNTIIEREEALHSDIVRTEYLDSYDNLSYKVLAAISWAVTHARPAPYVMKTDDDTYLNLPYLLHELRNNTRRVIDDVKKQGGDVTKYVIGALCVDSPVVRDEGDKWFVNDLDYPSDVYPRYVFGGGYVMTRSAAEAILAASFKSDYLKLEDVYITGILARVGEVTIVSHPGFAYWTSKHATPCDVVAGRSLTSVNMTSKQFRSMYSGIHSILRAGNWTKC